MNVKTEICNAFNAKALTYEQAAKVQHEIGNRLFERLHYLKIKPKHILDLGCGTGLLSWRLKKQYPDASLVGVDLAVEMLKQAHAKQRWRKTWALVNSDMTCLPFASGLFDLVIANQVIHWSESLSAVLGEVNRVMKAGGCLMFSTLGPDTFHELRSAWHAVDQHAHVNTFSDMHDLGDALLAEHFLDPVVDMEMLTAHYKSLPALLGALKAQGVRNIHEGRQRGLTGRHSWKLFEQNMEAKRTVDGALPLTYEVVYGHAWKGMQRRLEQGTETFFPIANLTRRKQHGIC